MQTHTHEVTPARRRQQRKILVTSEASRANMNVELKAPRSQRGERFLQLATDECEHRRLEARVVRRHERRRLHRVQPVVPVAAAGLRRAVATLQ